MNKRGVDRLLSNKFTLGADASVAAGPVGRTAAAQTDAAMTAEILSWSRSRGVFAGVALEGATLRGDDDANLDLYGKRLEMRQIVTGGTPVPGGRRGAHQPVVEVLIQGHPATAGVVDLKPLLYGRLAGSCASNRPCHLLASRPRRHAGRQHQDLSWTYLVLNCGSSSAKFAVIDPATSKEDSLRDRAASGFTRRHARLEARWSEGVPAHPGSGARSGPAGRRGAARRTRAHRRTHRRRPPRGARRLEVLWLDGHHAGSHRQGRRVHPPRAAAQPAEPGRHPPRAGTVPVAAAGRGVRHGVPSDDAAGGVHVPGALRVARGAQRAPLRLPRHQPPLRREASPAADGTVAGEPPAGDRPPRQRLLVRRGARRPERRHHDGAHAARGRHDGHAQRVGRPGDHRPHQRRARQACRSRSWTR